MPRPKKTHLDYFPLDVTFFNDMRIRKLIRHQGGKAVTVYLFMLCLIYGDDRGYYIGVDKELPFIISEQTGYDEAYIREVIKSCVAIGLFSMRMHDVEGVFTSRGIQKRYTDICRQMKLTVRVGKYDLLSEDGTEVSSEETGVSSEKTGVSSEKTRVNSENWYQKERKIKEEEKEKEKNNFRADGEKRENLCRAFAAYWQRCIDYHHSGMQKLYFPLEHADGIMRLYENFTKEEVCTFCHNAVQHPFLNRKRGEDKGPADFDWATATVERIRKIIEGQQYL